MPYRGPVVDVDVHHTWRSAAELMEYLPKRWRDYFTTPDGRLLPFKPSFENYASPAGHNKRLDSFPADGSPPGSDYETLRDQLLEKSHITHAILGYDAGLEGGHRNPYAAAALCRAANEWSIDKWLSNGDDRLHGAILVPTEWPEEAAREIRRLAGHPRMVEVLFVMNNLGKPFGHPVYNPIHEAAAETGLPLGLHVGGDNGNKGRSAAGGVPTSWLEQFVTLPQPGVHHASSFLTHGVFERYPNLHLCLKECGFTWVPALLWKLDSDFELLRRESPSVTRLPSEVFREHVTVSTQPFDYTEDSDQMVELLGAFTGIEEILCFASDYPHWDGDEPPQLAARLPKAWHDRFFFDNAARIYGWKRADVAEVARAAS